MKTRVGPDPAGSSPGCSHDFDVTSEQNNVTLVPSVGPGLWPRAKCLDR